MANGMTLLARIDLICEQEELYTKEEVVTAIRRIVAEGSGDAAQTGWKLVPITPTQAMIAAAENAREAYAPYAFADVYAEMLKSSPLPSTEGK